MPVPVPYRRGSRGMGRDDAHAGARIAVCPPIINCPVATLGLNKVAWDSGKEPSQVANDHWPAEANVRGWSGLSDIWRGVVTLWTRAQRNSASVVLPGCRRKGISNCDP